MVVALERTLGHQIGVLAQPVARPLDLDDDGVVQQPVEKSGGNDGVAEHLAPLGEATIGGEDHGEGGCLR